MMAKPTIADRLVAGLLKLGFEETRRTTRYRVFLETDLSRLQLKTQAVKIFVGVQGALRGSRSGRVADTFAYNDTVRERVLDAGDRK